MYGTLLGYPICLTVVGVFTFFDFLYFFYSSLVTQTFVVQAFGKEWEGKVDRWRFIGSAPLDIYCE